MQPSLKESWSTTESAGPKTREAVEGKEAQGETERVDEAQRRERTWRGPMDDARPVEQKNKQDLHRERKQEEEPNGRGRESDRDRHADQLLPFRTRKFLEKRMDLTEEAIRQTQQMQQRTGLMFSQVLDKTPRKRQQQVETGHVEDQRVNCRDT